MEIRNELFDIEQLEEKYYQNFTLIPLLNL
jgi:hypothetical protein